MGSVDRVTELEQVIFRLIEDWLRYDDYDYGDGYVCEFCYSRVDYWERDEKNRRIGLNKKFSELNSKGIEHIKITDFPHDYDCPVLVANDLLTGVVKE